MNRSNGGLGSGLWLVRLLVGLVTFFNLQCAVFFLVTPQAFAPAFELSGYQGGLVIASLGILFLMWNVPYLFALYHPVRFRISLLQACLMQAIGFLGETTLYLSMPAAHEILRGSILRFILFDGAGLLALLAAWVLVRTAKTLPGK